jgi:lysine 2,3-aminomutase
MQAQINWTHKFSSAFKNPATLYRFLGWEMPTHLAEVCDSYPLFIPERLANKIKQQGPDGVLAKEFLPHSIEIDADLNKLGLNDPIGDKNFNKAPQLIHRYSSRALFTPTSICPVHCRYCFRKNELDSSNELFRAQFQESLDYLKDHPEISEIIFTGGDPLTLSNEKIEKYLLALAEIPSIKDVRFHTRYPVILPERIDDGLIDIMNRAAKHFRTVSMAIHTNHVDEFDTEIETAILKLSQASIQLLSQTVLLKGINDSQKDLIDLIQLLIKLKVRPYYLHHPDQVKGGMHFYLPLQKGRKIYAQLRQKLPGWALPQYVIDVPGGHGKVGAFNPESLNYSGQLITQHADFIEVKEPDIFV